MAEKDNQNLDLSPFMRNQCYGEVLSNYYSRNPQPQQISSSDQFYTLYENFDIDFYKDLHQCHGYSDIEVFNHYHLVGKYQKSCTNNLIKIVFYSPPISKHNIGGINAVHRMAMNINSKCHDKIRAFIYTYDHIKHQNAYCNNFICPFEVDKNTIVVYPETISGNPLNAKYVIRWILLELGYEMPKDHYQTWNKDDLVYTWEPSKTKQLCIPWIDKYLLNLSEAHFDKKYDTCFMYRKMENVKSIKEYTNTIHPTDSIALDKLTNENIIKYFLNTKIFYSYDPNTFYNLIAPLCGCITVLHPIPGISKEQYLKNRITNNGDVLFDAGIAYGTEPSEMDHASSTLKLAKPQMLNLIKYYDNNCLSFIEDCIKFISNRKHMKHTVSSIFYNTSTYQPCQY